MGGGVLCPYLLFTACLKGQGVLGQKVSPPKKEPPIPGSVDFRVPGILVQRSICEGGRAQVSVLVSDMLLSSASGQDHTRFLALTWAWRPCPGGVRVTRMGMVALLHPWPAPPPPEPPLPSNEHMQFINSAAISAWMVKITCSSLNLQRESAAQESPSTSLASLPYHCHLLAFPKHACQPGVSREGSGC